MKTILVLLIISCVFSASQARVQSKAKSTQKPIKNIESEIKFKAGAYNPPASFHVKDPYYRFARQAPPPLHPAIKADREAAAQAMAAAQPAMPEPRYENTQHTVTEMKLKLKEFFDIKDTLAEQQAVTFAAYNKYLKKVDGLSAIQDNLEKSGAKIDRSLETQYDLITKCSHVTIGLLNLDAKLELFNYQNFRYLTTTTPELESLKSLYNGLNREVQKKRAEMTEMRRALDEDNALLWDAKNRMLWMDRYRNSTANDIYHNAVQTFERQNVANAGVLTAFGVPSKEEVQQLHAQRDEEFLREALEAVDGLEQIKNSKNVEVSNDEDDEQPRRRRSSRRASRRSSRRARYDDEDEEDDEDDEEEDYTPRRRSRRHRRYEY